MVPAQLFLFCVFVGSSLAVFYTTGNPTYPKMGRRSSEKGSQPHVRSTYPIMGKRAFYTLGSGNSYPRIGRRSLVSTKSLSALASAPHGDSKSSSTTSSASAAKDDSFVALLSKMAKRQFGGSLPHLGKRGGVSDASSDVESDMDDFARSLQSRLGERLGEMKDVTRLSESNSDFEDGEGEIDEQIIFIAFDTNGDGFVSKEEFSSGFSKYGLTSLSC